MSFSAIISKDGVPRAFLGVLTSFVTCFHYFVQVTEYEMNASNKIRIFITCNIKYFMPMFEVGT